MNIKQVRKNENTNACQLLAKKVQIAFFQVSIIHPKILQNIHARFMFCFTVKHLQFGNLTMNRLTTEQRLHIIEFYYQNACSIKKVHHALLPFCGQFNRSTTVILSPKCKSLTCMISGFNKPVPLATQHA